MEQATAAKTGLVVAGFLAFNLVSDRSFSFGYVFTLAIVFFIFWWICHRVSMWFWMHTAKGQVVVAEQQRLAQIAAEQAEAARIVQLRAFVVDQYRSYTGNPAAMLTDEQVAALMREAEHNAAVQGQLAVLQQGQNVQTALVFGALSNINNQIAHQNHHGVPEPWRPWQ